MNIRLRKSKAYSVNPLKNKGSVNSVNTVNITDKSTKKHGQGTIYIANQATKRECKLLLIWFTFILFLVVTNQNTRLIVYLSLYFCVAFLKVDALNIFMRLAPKSKDVICISVFILISLTLIHDYIGLCASILLGVVSLVAILAVWRQNSLWIIQAKQEESNEQIKQIKKQRRRIELLDKELNKLTLDYNILVNRYNDLARDNHELNEQVQEVIKANNELLEQVDEADQRAEAVESYAKSIKEKYEKLQNSAWQQEQNEIKYVKNSVVIPKTEKGPGEPETAEEPKEAAERQEPFTQGQENGIKDISDRDLKILSLLDLGMSLRKVGEAVGVSQTTVAKIKKKHKAYS